MCRTSAEYSPSLLVPRAAQVRCGNYGLMKRASHPAWPSVTLVRGGTFVVSWESFVSGGAEFYIRTKEEGSPFTRRVGIRDRSDKSNTKLPRVD